MRLWFEEDISSLDQVGINVLDGQRLGLCLQARICEKHGARLLVRRSPIEARDDTVDGGRLRGGLRRVK